MQYMTAIKTRIHYIMMSLTTFSTKSKGLLKLPQLILKSAIITIGRSKSYALIEKTPLFNIVQYDY
jgi:hypothetical protein